MATRRYSVNPQDAEYQVTDAVGAATATKLIELTVDWDGLAALTPAMSGQQARLQVLAALEKMHAHIEGAGKFNVKA